jgi:hypothetical protein
MADGKRQIARIMRLWAANVPILTLSKREGLSTARVMAIVRAERKRLTGSADG